MIYDEYGLPRDNGADDFQDSARLAGLATIFNYENKIELAYYTIKFLNYTKYFRHPKEFKYTFSRDQMICLFAGFKFQDRMNLVDPNYRPENHDFLSPSDKNHIKICAGLKPSRFGFFWLYLEIFFHAFVKPLSESNQLISKLMVIDDKKYLKLWMKLNKDWRHSILFYWCGWRGEKELAEKMIKTLESV